MIRVHLLLHLFTLKVIECILINVQLHVNIYLVRYTNTLTKLNSSMHVSLKDLTYSNFSRQRVRPTEITQSLTNNSIISPIAI